MIVLNWLNIGNHFNPWSYIIIYSLPTYIRHDGSGGGQTSSGWEAERAQSVRQLHGGIPWKSWLSTHGSTWINVDQPWAVFSGETCWRCWFFHCHILSPWNFGTTVLAVVHWGCKPVRKRRWHLTHAFRMAMFYASGLGRNANHPYLGYPWILRIGYRVWDVFCRYPNLSLANWWEEWWRKEQHQKSAVWIIMNSTQVRGLREDRRPESKIF